MHIMRRQHIALLLTALWLALSGWWLALGRPWLKLPVVQATAPTLSRPIPALNVFAEAALKSHPLPKSVTLEGVTVAIQRLPHNMARLCLPQGCAQLNLKKGSYTMKEN